MWQSHISSPWGTGQNRFTMAWMLKSLFSPHPSLLKNLVGLAWHWGSAVPNWGSLEPRRDQRWCIKLQVVSVKRCLLQNTGFWGISAITIISVVMVTCFALLLVCFSAQDSHSWIHMADILQCEGAIGHISHSLHNGGFWLLQCLFHLREVKKSKA